MRITQIPLIAIAALFALHAAAQDTTPAKDFERTVIERGDGARLNAYLRRGAGPTLVLVPGTWGGFWRFEEMIADLPPTLAVAVVELRWQGGNVPPSLDMTIEQSSDDVLHALAALKVERFVIAGHSIGGMVAVDIAGRDLPGLAGAIPMEGWTHHTVVDTAFGGVVTADLSPEEEARSQANRARGRAHLSEEALAAIGTIWRNWNGYAGLERSTVPILSLWGDRGKPHPDRAALQIPDRDNIQIGWIKDASHGILLEDPAEVARQVTAFMAQFEGAERGRT